MESGIDIFVIVIVMLFLKFKKLGVVLISKGGEFYVLYNMIRKIEILKFFLGMVLF